MGFFGNPKWINTTLLGYNSLDEIPDSLLDDLKVRLQSRLSPNPTVTIIIAAWNEEVNIVRCLDTLSRNQTQIPFDIIVVNNNSADRTQMVIDRLGVESYFQPVQGCGPARDMGQRKAKGKYILIADADCLYPVGWIETMSKKLSQEGVVFVYGRYSFLGTPQTPRWHFSIYDVIRDIMVEIRHIKRPYLNAYGISMGYLKEHGLKEGYLERNIRGDDGRLCFDLMKYGKVVLVRSSNARVWTGNRTLERDGSMRKSLVRRILREIARFDKYFTNPIPHNTKTSDNEDYSINESISIIKKKYNPFSFFRKKDNSLKN